jgi:hypothetical protein
MTTTSLTLCGCGTNLQETLNRGGATTVVSEAGTRFVLLHCPACGTLYVAVDERSVPRPCAGAGV